MSEKLFFDDSADSLVKDWLKGATAVEDTAKVAVKPLDAGNKKHGLGYEDKKPKLDSKDALLATRIRNQKKRKADEDAVEIHGLVEDEETSRTTITTKKQHPHVTQKQKKTVSNKAVTHTEKPLKSNPSPDDTLAVLSPLKRPEPDRTTDSTQPNTEKMKRKRPKTRSKQKNIRHDHRREDQKPEHLRIGSSTYTGRPLTEVCSLAVEAIRM